MKTKIVYRKPIGNQDHFVISTTYKRTQDVRRSLELLKDMYVNMVAFNRMDEKQAHFHAVACEEVGILGAFKYADVVQSYDFAIAGAKGKTLAIGEDVTSPEQLRMKVYASLLQGAKGIRYDSLFYNSIAKNGNQGAWYRYVQELNYRITQYGRTLMALKNTGVYCAADVLEKYPDFAKVAKPISESKILAEQELPPGLVIGEFKDTKGNGYLMIQNTDCEGSSTKAYTFQLKNNFRVYRVNPHDGKQMLSKESIDQQKILIVAGDADLLRYQNPEEEACFIEYALKK